ncbi:MAG: hypothetical protein ABII76_07615 [Pseudomonadota bacterium]
MVEFVCHRGESWTGNFAKGGIGGQSAVHSELGSSAVVVVAEGAGYIVDADEKKLVREIAGDIQYIWFVAELNAMIVSNGLGLRHLMRIVPYGEAVASHGTVSVMSLVQTLR